MPQLDGSIYITQIFWLIVSFLSFWLIMDKILIPKISEKIEARKRKQDDFILKAEEINQKALDALSQYENKLAVAKNEAIREIAENEKELQNIIEEKQNQINQQLKQKVAESEQILKTEITEIVQNIDDMSKNIALVMTQQLNLTSITKEDIEQIAAQEGNN